MRQILLLLFCVGLLSACTALPPNTNNQQVTNRGSGKDQWWDALPRAAWARFPRIGQRQAWFEIYLVAPGVYAIYEPGQFEEVISYLITGSDAALLFDTGLGIADIRTLTGQLTGKPVTVLNSHTHYDHIGGNHQFDNIIGIDTDFSRGHAAGLPHAAVSEAVGPGWIWQPVPPGFDPATYTIAPYKVGRFVVDGQQIELGGRTLEVIFTPGHTPDSLCLIDRESRLLFTGDTFYPAPLYTHLDGSDFAAYVVTAHRLAKLAADVDLLMPGHNEPAVSADYLGKLKIAFDRIVAGEAGYVVTDDNREYAFDGFSIITR